MKEARRREIKRPRIVTWALWVLGRVRRIHSSRETRGPAMEYMNSIAVGVY
jgi:hypothetical protein